MESAPARGGEADHQMKFAALIADHEKSILHAPRAESPCLVQPLEEGTHLRRRQVRHLFDDDVAG